VQEGQRTILPCRGKPLARKPVARIEPIVSETPNGDDLFYSLSELNAPDRVRRDARRMKQTRF
jgi:hypothetical protein